MRLFVIILIQVFFFKSTFSQIKYSNTLAYSDTISCSYISDLKTLKKHIYNGIPSEFKTSKRAMDRMSYVFSDNAAYEIQKELINGDVYNNWPELENYLNRILKQVLPPELSRDSIIHIYIVQDGSFNAFMTPSGQIFMNIGVFSEVFNESQIASVIAHELAHYYLKHSIKYYIETETGAFNGKVFNRKLSNTYSRKIEDEADSLALVWLNMSGYNINGLLFTYQTLDRIETNILSKLEDIKKIKNSTHPDAKERISKMEERIKKLKNSDGKFFIIDESLFYKMREQAKPEILRAYFSNFEYEECIEQAFKFHLFDPDNIYYINYILESIRRICYLDKSVGDKYFITNRYFEDYDYGGGIRKKPVQTHLFSSFNFNILHMDVRVASQINAKFYWRDTPRFTTYDEAYDFFYKLCKALGDYECDLSYSLKNIKKDSLKHIELLKEYLSHPDILYRDFAENMLQQTLTGLNINRKMIVYSDMDICIRVNSIDLFIDDILDEKRSLVKELVDTLKSKDSCNMYLFLPSLFFYNYKSFKILKEIENFSFTPIISKGERAEFYILCPEYWTFFQSYKVDEIEFVNSIYTINIQKEKNSDEISFLSKCAEMECRTVFTLTGNTKYFDVMFSSVRMKPGKLMKYKFMSVDNVLQFNNAGFNEVIKRIEESMAEKEKRCNNADYMYYKYDYCSGKYK